VHRTFSRPTTSLVLALALLLAFAAPALAAAPSNDSRAGATAITAIPYSASLDTSEATTDAEDAEVNAHCGPPAIDATVWYTLTLALDTHVIVDASGSSYSAGIAVVTGVPGSFALVACGPGAVAIEAASGTTYTILIFDYQGDGGGNGGTLELSVDAAPPAPTVDVTVDPVATFNKTTGGATVTGTITCTGETFGTHIDVQLRQRVGRATINGFGFTSFTCDGTTHTWSAEIFTNNGVFKGGKAASVTIALACGLQGCAEDFEEVQVQLRG
jgi:hypothetical protein